MTHNDKGHTKKQTVHMRKNVLTILITALLCGGFVACSNESTPPNPFNIEVPTWQEFAHPKDEGVIVYKNADATGPYLQFAAEPCEGDACNFMILWSDEEAPRGWGVNTETVNNYSAFPILGEEGEFYKVYVSREWLGAVEGYIKKSDCNITKPETLTQALIDSIGKTAIRRDYIIKEGELKNLCLSSYLGEYDGIEFRLGQLCNNCLVFINTKPLMLNPLNENSPIQLSRDENDENESFILVFGTDQLWQPNEESPAVFDTQKLSEEQVKNIYISLKAEDTKPTEILYYLPEVSKDRLQSIFIYETSSRENTSNTDNQDTTVDEAPETVARQLIERAMARDGNGVKELLTGKPDAIEWCKNTYIAAFREVTGYTITKCEINGDHAKVRFKVSFQKGLSEKDVLNLVKEANGSWRVIAD